MRSMIYLHFVTLWHRCIYISGCRCRAAHGPAFHGAATLACLHLSPSETRAGASVSSTTNSSTVCKTSQNTVLVYHCCRFGQRHRTGSLPPKLPGPPTQTLSPKSFEHSL